MPHLAPSTPSALPQEFGVSTSVAKTLLQECGGDLQAALTRLVAGGHAAVLDDRAVAAVSAAAVLKDE